MDQTAHTYVLLETVALGAHEDVRRIAAPNDETMFQDLVFAEPVFQAIERANGAYGCAHSAGTGWTLSSREPGYQGGAKLPAQVSFVQSRDEQWSNCDYNAHESLSISGTGENLTLSFRIANGAAATRPWGGAGRRPFRSVEAARALSVSERALAEHERGEPMCEWYVPASRSQRRPAHQRTSR